MALFWIIEFMQRHIVKNAVDEKHPARLANRFAGRLFRPEGKKIPTDIAIGNGGDYILPTYIGASALISNKPKGIPMTWILKYWKPLLGGVAVLAVIYGEVQYGRQCYQAGYDAATAAITAKMMEQHQQHQKTAREASVEYQQGKSKRDEKGMVRREVVQKIIERPVYIDDCTDASGVSVLNAAIAERR